MMIPWFFPRHRAKTALLKQRANLALEKVDPDGRAAIVELSRRTNRTIRVVLVFVVFAATVYGTVTTRQQQHLATVQKAQQKQLTTNQRLGSIARISCEAANAANGTLLDLVNALFALSPASPPPDQSPAQLAYAKEQAEIGKIFLANARLRLAPKNCDKPITALTPTPSPTPSPSLTPSGAP